MIPDPPDPPGPGGYPELYLQRVMDTAWRLDRYAAQPQLQPVRVQAAP